MARRIQASRRGFCLFLASELSAGKLASPVRALYPLRRRVRGNARARPTESPALVVSSSVHATALAQSPGTSLPVAVARPPS